MTILGTHANCANITNLTRISATSVVVEWKYQSSSLSMNQEFDIHISDYENSSVIQQLTIVPSRNDGGRYAYLVNNTAADTQLVCFIVSVGSDILGASMMPRSSGDAAEEMCPKKCLPSIPGESKCRRQALFTSYFWSSIAGAS